MGLDIVTDNFLHLHRERFFSVWDVFPVLGGLANLGDFRAEAGIPVVDAPWVAGSKATQEFCHVQQILLCRRFYHGTLDVVAAQKMVGVRRHNPIAEFLVRRL